MKICPIYSEMRVLGASTGMGTPAQRTRFAGVDPQGIEIRQTMFAITSMSEEGNIIFLRYRISNSGLQSEILDSVIFSVWADPDLGDHEDDLVGVDVSRNAGFTYNGDDDDPQYGSQIPSFFMDFLSGPAAYIPGETFIDNNFNGTYEDSIDTPLDTAYTFRGQLLGIKEFPGAKNLDISSFVHYFSFFKTIQIHSIQVQNKISNSELSFVLKL